MAGIIRTIPKEDINAATIGTIVGVILYNFAAFLGNAPLFGAIVGALSVTAHYIKHPYITDAQKAFISVEIFSVVFIIRVTNMALGIGAAGATGGLIIVALISMALIHSRTPNDPFFDPFRYRPIFAAIAGICAGVGILTVFSTIYIVGFFTQKVEFPVSVGRSDITVAIAGAAIGGYILAMIMNVLGIRFVDGAYRRFNDQSVAAIRGILRRIDIILGAIGAISGTCIIYIGLHNCVYCVSC